MLMRFDPFRELDRLAAPGWAGRATTMPMDAYREGDHFVVHVDLPGVDPSSVDLTIEKNVLAITAERRWGRDEGQQVLLAERPQGSVSRQLFLGDGLDAENIQASYEHGVLTVTIPVAEQAKPRRVEISTGPAKPEAIETTTAA
jgi:HSP20 family protein